MLLTLLALSATAKPKAACSQDGKPSQKVAEATGQNAPRGVLQTAAVALSQASEETVIDCAALRSMDETYVVQSGDTIVDIAQAYGTLSSNVFTSQGTIPDPYALFTGQALLIRLAPQAPETTHRVVAGETLLIIAQQHNKSLAALQAANPNADTYRLQPGQDLSLPHHGASTSGAGAHRIRAWGVDQ